MQSSSQPNSSVSTVVMDLPSGEAFACLPVARSAKVVSIFPGHSTQADYSIGDVFVVILAVIVAATAMTQIAPQILALTKASSSAEELFKTIDRQSEIDPLSEEGKVPKTCEGVIEIENVTFSYPARPDTTVLKGFRLSAPANKTTALVGASGSGKSTIIGLLGELSSVRFHVQMS